MYICVYNIYIYIYRHLYRIIIYRNHIPLVKVASKQSLSHPCREDPRCHHRSGGSEDHITVSITIFYCLVVWNMFPYIANNHLNWRAHIFQVCRYTTNHFYCVDFTCDHHESPHIPSWCGSVGTASSLLRRCLHEALGGTYHEGRWQVLDSKCNIFG